MKVRELVVGKNNKVYNDHNHKLYINSKKGSSNFHFSSSFTFSPKFRQLRRNSDAICLLIRSYKTSLRSHFQMITTFPPFRHVKAKGCLELIR